jgi:hypothetical protein
MSKRLKTAFDRDFKSWMKDPEFATGYHKGRWRLARRELKRRQRIIDHLVAFAKEAYCHKNKFDTCGDPFCSDARAELARILGSKKY